MKRTVVSLPKSQKKVSGELEWQLVEAHLEDALGALANELEVDGFRKGKVPPSVAKVHIPEMVLLQEAAERALAKAFPEILKEESIDAIGRPTIALTKLAHGNPLGYEIVLSIFPEVKLPDYKKSAKGVKKADATDPTEEEINAAIKELQKMRAHDKWHEQNPTADHHDHPDFEKDATLLPEINDEFAKSLGKFETLADLQAKIRENMTEEKKAQAREKHRVSLIEAIDKDTTLEIPDVIVEAELDRLLFRLETDLAHSGLSIEEYLKHMGKTKEDLRTDFRADAEKRARYELMLHAIAKAEPIVPSEEKINERMEQLLKQQPTGDKERARAFAQETLTNEAVLEFLENL